MQWLFLATAIVSEVIGTTLMKLSDGFTKIPFIAGMLVAYVTSLILLSMALKNIEVGVAYAIWSGFGIVLVSTIGIVFFNESIGLWKILFIGLIICGVIGLHLVTKSH